MEHSSLWSTTTVNLTTRLKKGKELPRQLYLRFQALENITEVIKSRNNIFKYPNFFYFETLERGTCKTFENHRFSIHRKFTIFEWFIRHSNALIFECITKIDNFILLTLQIMRHNSILLIEMKRCIKWNSMFS